LATARLWSETTLATEFAVEGAAVEELYGALDWLAGRQEAIEGRLAARHLREGALVLYDVTSSYYEGRHCPLARYGHNRDEKKGRPIIVYGLLTDGVGRPVAVHVYPGNTADPKTVPDQVAAVRERFGLERVVLVGDRGMLTETRIETLRAYPQLGWISALRSAGIRKLVNSGAIQLSLFDRQNLAEIASEDYPGERLVVCHNPLLAADRRRTREELLAATEQALEKIRKEAARRTKKFLTDEEIALKVGRVINGHKMAKHFDVTIEAGRLAWARREEAIAAEQALDGLYVVRTSETAERMSAADAVRSYKSLALVERMIRMLKGLDLLVRPIFHRLDGRVRAHIFLCMLAYYVEWHLRVAWAPLLFEDEELPERRAARDPVAPAEPSAAVKAKKRRRTTDDGLPLHSFDTLLAALGTRCRNRCRLQRSASKGQADDVTFDRVTEPTSLQQRAMELLKLLPVTGNTNER
jgi:transposase